jgi:O-antigen/teichoic acid export membrane protein
MDKTNNATLKKITKGAAVVLFGTIIGMIFSFFVQIIVVRNLSPQEYGVFSLVFVLVSLAVSLASFGLEPGITRYIAFYRAQKDGKKILGTIVSAIEISVFAGLFFFCLIFFGSSLFADIYASPGLSAPLKIYAIAIPFLLLITISLSVYRGFERADIKVIFQQILQNGIRLFGLGFIAILGFSLFKVLYVFLGSAIITGVLLIFYSQKKFRQFFHTHRSPFPMRKTLLFFSLPLLARSFFSKILSWSDVLLLGYFKEEATVGIYNATLALAEYIPIFLTATIFLYVPLATQVYVKRNTDSFKRNYAIITKWVFSATLPVFLIIFLFPSVVLNLLYGSDYIAASAILRILAAGFLIHSFLGPNAASLIIIGKTKFLMFSSTTAVIINILLNLLLIPPFGMLGAAIASAVSLICINVLNSIKFYHDTRIHPFTRNYIKPVFVSLSSIFVVYFFANKLLTISWWMLPVLFVVLILIYGAALVLTKSFDKEDIMLLLAIEKRSGFNFNFAKRILKKFL